VSPQAVDYSFARPNPADLAAAGYVGALRYLAPLPNTKVITGDEVASLHANGLAIGFVWESGANRSSQGYAAGKSDAQAANLMADDLGVPDNVVIYFAVDYDADPSAVEAYFQGARDGSSRPTGGYGSFRVVEYLLDLSLIVKAWQTVAWSHGKKSNRAHLYQRADGTPPAGCDVNDVQSADWGQWAPASVPQPQPVPPSEDDEMLWLLQDTRDGTTPFHADVWLSNLLTRRHVGDDARLADLATLNGETAGKQLANGGKVRLVSEDFLADIPIVA
jgi:hypothetical protein